MKGAFQRPKTLAAAQAVAGVVSETERLASLRHCSRLA